MLRLVQLHHPKKARRVALVEENKLRLLNGPDSIYALAQECLRKRSALEKFVRAKAGLELVSYDDVYLGASDWRLLPAYDHPEEPARCLVTGTGLTHKASAENRQAMHSGKKPTAITDSMRMYQWGLEGGRPLAGKIGVAPEWFYKGSGTILRAHGEPLDVPEFGNDGGEEAEVAGAYLVDSSGKPRRVGLMMGNEFSDHKMEAKNYLYLAPSKLRTCAVGPELIVGGDFQDARGNARIWRGKKVLWSSEFATGERNMSHTVGNLEHHHFKYAAHRRAGDAHIHFFGADAFSFGDGVELSDGDVMEIVLAGFGRALRNPIRIEKRKQRLVSAFDL
jgi:hypothetical protein